MAILQPINMKEWRQMKAADESYLEEWEAARIVKKCRKCKRNFYSYPRGDDDPGCCQECR